MDVFDVSLEYGCWGVQAEVMTKTAVDVYQILGAAAGSPYIVFISTSGK